MAYHSHLSEETTLMFQLKGGLYPLTVLQLLGTDLSAFEQQLTAKIQQAPKFFHRAPVVIDLQKLFHANPILDFKRLLDILTDKKLIPIGIKGGTTDQEAAAMLVGLPTLQDNGKNLKTETQVESSFQLQEPAVSEKATEIKGSNTKVVTEPVRSGQQIYVRGGDLIVLAPVSHGSELLADGHIHIYGPLRGRALAGVTGDETAHIFCQSLEAELISIAGHYKISEDIDQTTWQHAVDVSLQGRRLHIQPF